jgi:hypothetical protein
VSLLTFLRLFKLDLENLGLSRADLRDHPGCDARRNEGAEDARAGEQRRDQHAESGLTPPEGALPGAGGGPAG